MTRMARLGRHGDPKTCWLPSRGRVDAAIVESGQKVEEPHAPTNAPSHDTKPPGRLLKSSNHILNFSQEVAMQIMRPWDRQYAWMPQPSGSPTKEHSALWLHVAPATLPLCRSPNQLPFATLRLPFPRGAWGRLTHWLLSNRSKASSRIRRCGFSPLRLRATERMSSSSPDMNHDLTSTFNMKESSGHRRFLRSLANWFVSHNLNLFLLRISWARSAAHAEGGLGAYPGESLMFWNETWPGALHGCILHYATPARITWSYTHASHRFQCKPPHLLSCRVSRLASPCLSSPRLPVTS